MTEQRIPGHFTPETINGALGNSNTWELDLPFNAFSGRVNGYIARFLIRDAIRARELGAGLDHQIFDRLVLSDDSDPTSMLYFQKRLLKVKDISPDGNSQPLVQTLAQLEVLLAEVEGEQRPELDIHYFLDDLAKRGELKKGRDNEL